MIEDVLKNIGLTESESKVYIAIVNLGKATSGQILDYAEMNTGKIYDILNSLANKGFISEVTESGVKKFFPADPKNIQHYLEEKKQVIVNQENEVSKILPELLSKVNAQKEDVRVEVFFELKGLKTSRLKEAKRYSKNATLRCFGVVTENVFLKKISDYFKFNIYPKREKSGVKIKKILNINDKKYKKEQEKASNIKFFPYSSPVTITVIKDLTLIDIKSQDHLVISIESQKVADSFIEQFEALWKIAK